MYGKSISIKKLMNEIDHVEDLVPVDLCVIKNLSKKCIHKSYNLQYSKCKLYDLPLTAVKIKYRCYLAIARQDRIGNLDRTF